MNIEEIKTVMGLDWVTREEARNYIYEKNLHLKDKVYKKEFQQELEWAFKEGFIAGFAYKEKTNGHQSKDC